MVPGRNWLFLAYGAQQCVNAVYCEKGVLPASVRDCLSAGLSDHNCQPDHQRAKYGTRRLAVEYALGTRTPGGPLEARAAAPGRKGARPRTDSSGGNRCQLRNRMEGPL